MIQLYVYIYVRKHNQQYWTNEHSSLEKIYLSLFIFERVAKRLMLVLCERWVGDGTDCNIFANLQEWVRFSLGAPFNRPCATSKQKSFVDYNILTVSSSDYSSTSFSFCWAAQPGVTKGHKLSVSSSFSLPRTATQTPTNWLQLTQGVCGTWLYNCLTYTCFLLASQLHRIQPVHRSRWYPDIFDRMHLFLDWRLGRGSICYRSTASSILTRSCFVWPLLLNWKSISR